jgi:hypothetical protein
MLATRPTTELPRGALFLILRSAVQVALATLLILGGLPALLGAVGH